MKKAKGKNVTIITKRESFIDKKPIETKIDSIQKLATEIPEVSIDIINRKGYFQRHFTLCRFHKTQQDAFDQCEEEYQTFAAKLHLDKKIMFGSYESFRNAKSNYYSNQNNR